jgi:hypothetical protein
MMQKIIYVIITAFKKSVHIKKQTATDLVVTLKIIYAYEEKMLATVKLEATTV